LAVSQFENSAESSMRHWAYPTKTLPLSFRHEVQ
jgi:hypothetical protein